MQPSPQRPQPGALTLLKTLDHSPQPLPQVAQPGRIPLALVAYGMKET